MAELKETKQEVEIKEDSTLEEQEQSSKSKILNALVNEEDDSENDDTYFSSITPEAEADAKELEEEGLSVEDVGESEEE